MVPLRVFVSSTFRDLEPVRERLIRAIQEAGDFPVAMETFGARPDKPLAVCLGEVQSADVFVLILGGSYGSVDPTTGLSYTHLEYQEAVKQGVPVLAFIVSARGDPTDVAPEDKPLESFREEVSAGLVVRFLDDPQRIPELAMAALRRHIAERANRIGQFCAFQDYRNFFAGLLDPNAIFSHVHQLVGRADELASLQAFLDGQAFVCVLPGAGGVGKSKLLLELARRRESRGPRMLFLGPQFDVTPERLRELPDESVCVVVDDAHRLSSLSELIAIVVGAARHHPIKALLTCRPSGLDWIRHTLRSLSPALTVILPELHPLDRRATALGLARALLGDLQEWAPPLVEASDGNPLVITVGAKLICNGRIPPQTLSQREHFQSAALDGLMVDIPARIATDVPTDRLMELLAVISPISPGRDRSQELIAEHLRVAMSSIARAIPDLRRYGVLVQRSSNIRIQPDVLADHLLYRAAVVDGRPTGFVTEVFNRFGVEFSANILTNASELEWRCRLSGHPVSVLSDVWCSLERNLPNMSFRSRGHLLESLKNASWFAPAEVWRLIEWLTANSSAPQDEDEVMRAFDLGQDQRYVMARMPKLLGHIAWHQEFSRRSAQALWSLEEADDRASNMYLQHPRRTLEDLLSFEVRKPIAIQEGVFEGLAAAVHNERREGKWRNVGEVLSKLLVREAEHTESTRDGFTIGFLPVRADNAEVMRLRKRAQEILEEQAEGPDPSLALRAVDQLDNLLIPPHGMMGRTVSDAERVSWQPEAQECLERLVRVTQLTRFPAVTFDILRRLRNVRSRNHWAKLAPLLDHAIGQIAHREDFELFDALLPEWVHEIDPDEREKAPDVRREHTRAAMTRLLEEYAGMDALLGRIEGAAASLVAAGIGIQTYSLMNAFQELRPSDVPVLARALLAGPWPTLRLDSPAILRHWMAQDAVSAIAAIRNAIETGDEQTCLGIAQGYSGAWFGRPGRDCAGNLENIRRLLTAPHEAVRRVAIHALRWAEGACEREAIDILVSLDLHGDEKQVDQALMNLHKPRGLDPNLLTEEDIGKLLSQIQLMPDLGRQEYWIDQFLSFASSRCPQAVVRALLARVHYAASLPDGRAREFQPLPYTDFHVGLEGLFSSPQYCELLREVRDQSTQQHWVYAFWMPKLFRFISAAYCTQALGVLDEWIGSGDSERINAAAHLLREADPDFLFVHHDFVQRLLTRAGAAGPECLRNVSSNLFAAVVSGTYSSAPGEPPPRLVDQRDGAQELASRYANNPHIARFYRSVVDWAEQEIQRHLAEFLEMDE